MKTKLQTIVKEIHDYCITNADPKNVEKYARYFKEGFDSFGLSQEKFTSFKEHLLETYEKQVALPGFLDLGDRLMQSKKFEEVSYAIICVAHFKKEFTHEHFQRVGRWLETGIRNWAHTDILCSEILSPCLVHQIVTLDSMADWRTSEHKYKRRAVPVAMIPWIKKTRKPKPAIQFIDSLMLDPERVVHQGLGWFLREAWKIDPKPVETHLKKWKESAPRLIFQYATEKMTKEQKEAFRRTKKKK